MDDSVTYMAIDPGQSMAGIAILTFNFSTLTFTRMEAFTSITPNNLHRRGLGAGEGSSYRFAKATHQSTVINQYAAQYKPAFVVVESPFFSMDQPGAFRPLVELLATIRFNLNKMSASTPMILYEPREVKASVGCKRMSKKEEVVKAMLLIPEITDLIDLSTLSEHAIDAIAVGYKHMSALRALYQQKRICKHVPLSKKLPKSK